MQEHRFAFYYWLKWTNELNGEVPSLVTFDWHQDLCPPYEDQVAELKSLDVVNPVDVALYTWGKLSHDNDVQIHAALKHNKLKDVYVICRQKTHRKNIETLKDFNGNKHHIHIFKSIEEFQTHIPKIQDQKIYLDIDLDFFTLSNPLSVGCPFKQQKYTYIKSHEIKEMLSLDNPVIDWIFNRLAGFTIATEPKFCGGFKKSNAFMQIIDKLYFHPSLFYFVPGSAWKHTQWKHLK